MVVNRASDNIILIVFYDYTDSRNFPDNTDVKMERRNENRNPITDASDTHFANHRTSTVDSRCVQGHFVKL